MKKAIIMIICICIVEIILILIFDPSAFLFWTPGMISYIMAYYIGAYWNKTMTLKIYSSLSLAMISASAARLIIKHYADLNGGSNIKILYDQTVIPYSHCILGFWLFFTIYKLLTRFDSLSDKLYNICKTLDKYSYEIYICHFMFLAGVLSMRDLTSIIAINIILAIMATICYAIILNRISRYILNCLHK